MNNPSMHMILFLELIFFNQNVITRPQTSL